MATLKPKAGGGTVSAAGFSEHLAALNGNYQESDENHGRKTFFKATTQIEGCTQSCIYYWDARDGDQMQGWWLAPSIGSEQVWSFNPAKNAETPPLVGWRVPWHEAKPNSNIRINYKAAGGAGGVKRASENVGAAAQPAAKQQKTANGAVAGR